MPTTSLDSNGQLSSSSVSETPSHDSPQKDNQVNSFKLLQEVSPKVQQELDLIDAIIQAPNKGARRQAIERACEVLGKHHRSIMRKVKCLQEEGITSLARGRTDNGQFRISEQWYNFVVRMYKKGRKDSLRFSPIRFTCV
jgi:putative transposase